MRPNPSVLPSVEAQPEGPSKWNEDVRRVLSGGRPRFGHGRAVSRYMQARILEELEHICVALRVPDQPGG